MASVGVVKEEVPDDWPSEDVKHNVAYADSGLYLSPWQYLIQRVLDSQSQESITLIIALLEEMSLVIKDFSLLFSRLCQKGGGGEKVPFNFRKNFSLVKSLLDGDPEQEYYLNLGLNVEKELQSGYRKNCDQTWLQSELGTKENGLDQMDIDIHHDNFNTFQEPMNCDQRFNESSDEPLEYKVKVLLPDKPKMTWAQLAHEALVGSENKTLTIEQIKQRIMAKHSYYQQLPDDPQPSRGWVQSLKHAMKSNNNFVRVEQTDINKVKECFWSLASETKEEIKVGNNSDSRDWRPIFPVDPETWQEMKSGTRPKECPRCGMTSTSDPRTIMSHWINNECENYISKQRCFLMAKEITGLENKKDRRYVCTHEDCVNSDKTYTTRVAVQMHYNNKHKDSYDGKFWQCPQCPEEFIVEHVLKAHFRDVHLNTEKKFPCAFCGESFTTRKKARYHETTKCEHRMMDSFKEDSKEFPHLLVNLQPDKPKLTWAQLAHEALVSCESRKMSLEELKQAIMAKHYYYQQLPDDPLPSKSWVQSLKSAIRLNQNFVEVQEMGNNKLKESYWALSEGAKNDPTTEKGYKWRPIFPVDPETWEQMKAGTRPKECPKCGVTSTSDPRFIIAHWVKEECDKVISKKKCFQMAKEITGKENKKDRRYVCTHSDCANSDTTYTTRTACQLHYNSKHKDSYDGKVLECPQCPETFIVHHALQQHFRLKHVEGSSHPCSFCGKVFSSSQQRNRHETTKCHENKMALDTKITCEYCGTKVEKDYYKTHKKTYCVGIDRENVERMPLFSCEVCGKEFASKGKVKEHMSTHDSRPDPKFQCPICHKFMKQHNSYRKHMVNVHKQGHNCDVCNKMFFDAEFLKRHKRDVHGS